MKRLLGNLSRFILFDIYMQVLNKTDVNLSINTWTWVLYLDPVLSQTKAIC